MFFGYQSVAEPVRVGVIGTGDEGGVLIGAMNPKYIAVKAIADIRPYSVYRAFHGDHFTEANTRPGLLAVYQWKTEDAARKEVKVYGDYRELIAHAKDDKLEAVIIALPLHLHAPVAIAAMQAGLHVLTEKLMAHSVCQCKEMALAAKQTDRLLATGHQRHYNIVYDNAVALVRQGLLGELHYIRAQCHRGDLPGNDSWRQPLPPGVKTLLEDAGANKLADELATCSAELADAKNRKGASPGEIKKLEAKVAQKKAQIADKMVDAKKFHYQDLQLTGADGKVVNRPALEELIRWRLWDRTGAGMMAELGSEQLDAASMFIAAIHGDEKHHPLTVAGAGNRPLFPDDRQIEDHVCCIFEFPAPGYEADDRLAARKKIGLQYASINGNDFGGYGETVLGTEGTLVLESERDAMLFKGPNNTAKTKVLAGKKKKGEKTAKPTLEFHEDGDEESADIARLAMLRAECGYAEELEHWAWCIRNRDPKHLPLGDPTVALGNAVVALVANKAVREGLRIDFKPAWFDSDQPDTPEGDKPDLSNYKS